MLMKPEQKYFKHMITNVAKLFKVVELLLHTCACALVTAESYLQLPKHYRSVGYEKDFVRFQNALLSPMKVYSEADYEPRVQVT